MRRWLAVPVLFGLLCAPLTGCGGDRPKPPPITVPEITTPASSVPTAAPPPSGAPVTTSSIPPGPPAPLPGAGTADVSSPRPAHGHLSGVRVARQDGYDRLVLQFSDQVPGYTVGYRPLPARADGSGAEIPLPGATAMVQVTLTPASAHREDTGAPSYPGPATVSGNTVRLTEAKAAGDFEAVVTWVVGMRAEVPFRVLVLAGPPRLVVDFQH